MPYSSNRSNTRITNFTDNTIKLLPLPSAKSLLLSGDYLKVQVAKYFQYSLLGMTTCILRTDPPLFSGAAFNTPSSSTKEFHCAQYDFSSCDTDAISCQMECWSAVFHSGSLFYSLSSPWSSAISFGDQFSPTNGRQYRSNVFLQAAVMQTISCALCVCILMARFHMMINVKITLLKCPSLRKLFN